MVGTYQTTTAGPLSIIDLFVYQSKIVSYVKRSQLWFCCSLRDRADRSPIFERVESGVMESFLSSVERRAYRMAYIATGSREDALDIVQDAMIKLVQKYADRDETEWGPLFHRIMQSHIRDWYRRSKIRNGLRSLLGWDDEGDPLDKLPSCKTWGPDDQLQADGAMDQLDAAIHHLPLRQQQAFLLRCWEGLDTAQTADAMGCSTGSVKTHYSRALGALRKSLEGQQL